MHTTATSATPHRSVIRDQPGHPMAGLLPTRLPPRQPRPGRRPLARIQVEAMRGRNQAFHARALLLDYLEWVRLATGTQPLAAQEGFAEELDDLARAYPGGARTLFLAWWAGIPAGMVALRCAADGTAELKRLYVRPVARGSGVADALVHQVVEAATAHPARTLWLETLRGVMDPAISVYQRHGFAVMADRGKTIRMNGMVTMGRTLDTSAAEVRALRPRN